jgi:CHAT domain-containing protein
VKTEFGIWVALDRKTAPEKDAPSFFDPSLERFRLLVTDKDSDPDEVASLGRYLFTFLFPAEAKGIVLNAKQLILAPDGLLWNIPFAALVVNNEGTPEYLGDRVPVTYSQSFRLFEQSRAEAPHLKPGDAPRALIVGDPLFERNQTSGAQGRERAFTFANGRPPDRLPATRVEAQSIASLYRAEALLDGDATEETVRKQIEGADVIEFATHGFLHPSVSMSSGVLLAPPSKESAGTSDDGILQAWEIFSQLKLRAELVVLSACRSALGKSVKFEGIVGLTRALQYAGARSVVASQWSVEDKSSGELMISLHRNLRAGMQKDEALRQAMRAVRSDARTAHPYYWAPFVLMGDPRNPNLAAKEAR